MELLPDGTESDVEWVNALRREPTRIEYFARNSQTLATLDWSDLPAALHAEGEIERTIEIARELEADDEADDDFGSGAWS